MATVTRLRTDKTSYARHEVSANMIGVTVTLTAAMTGDTLVVSLVREDGYGSVGSATIGPLVGGEMVARTSIALESCTDALYPAINRARSGRYHVSCGGVVSPSFDIALVSIGRMRDQVCKGLPLLTGETIGPLQQPRLVAGITITQVKPDVPGDLYVLTYIASGQFLSWDGGTPVAVGNGGSFYLVDSLQKYWVQVQVDETLLPTTNQTETIIVDEQQMTDEQVLAEIRHAEADIADQCKFYLEPTQVITQQLQTWLGTHTPTPLATPFADAIVPAVDYIQPAGSGWLSFQLPFRRLIQLEALHGFLNQSDVVTIDQTWWSWTELTGEVTLVPNQAAALIWQTNAAWFYSFLSGYSFIPLFWHAKATVGIRDLKGPRANILQAVEYRAAINLLRQAALHAKPGYTSESIARDGMSQEIRYQQAIYGDTITLYQNWLDSNLPQIFDRHFGINMLLFG